MTRICERSVRSTFHSLSARRIPRMERASEQHLTRGPHILDFRTRLPIDGLGIICGSLSAGSSPTWVR
jgi:hypothetical protein